MAKFTQRLAMNILAKPTENQLSLTASLDAGQALAQASSTYWPEIASKLEALTKEIAIALAARVSSLYIFDPRRQRLYPYFSWPVLRPDTYFTEQVPGEGIVGLTAQSRRPVRVDDLKNDPRFRLVEADFPHKSVLAVPLLLAQDEPLVGVVLVADKMGLPAFSAQDELLLSSLVEQFSLALIIKKANLAREKREQGQELTVLSQISQTLNDQLHLMDVDSACRAILQLPNLKATFQFDAAEICLWNAQTKTLTTALRLVYGSPDIQSYARTYRLSEGYTGWIAAHQKSLLIEDTHRFSQATPRIGLASFPYRSVLGVPLKIGLKLLGTLELVAAPIHAYESSDVTVLEIVANHAAVAIDHAHLFQEAQRTLSKLTLLFDASQELSSTLSHEDLLHDLSLQMVEAFSADECAVYKLDPSASTLTLVEKYIKPISNQGTESPPEALPLALAKFPVLQAALKAQALCTIRLDDANTAPHETEWLEQQSYGVMVAIPLISRDEVTGLVQLFSANPQAFSEDEIWLAQSLANQVNIAIENATLFSLTDQQLQTRVNELAGLQRVSSELNSTLDLNRILEIVLEEAIRVTHADFGNVNIYDTQTGGLVAHKEQGWPGKTASRNNKRNSRRVSGVQGIMGRALHTGQPILVPDVSKDKDYITFNGDTRSKVVVPIYYSGEPAGVINLESKRLDFFNSDQLRYLEALANQAAVAIGNTQAYQEQKRERERANRRADQLARLSEISNAFRTNRPLPEILEDVAYAIAETVGYSVVLVSLVEGNPGVIRHKVGAGIPIAQLEILQNQAQPCPLVNLQAITREEFRLSNSYFIPVERMAVWEGKLDVPHVEKSRSSSQSLAETERLSSSTAPSKEKTWQTDDVLFIPLADTEDNIIGLLTVEHPDIDERPDILLVQTLEIFANHAAAAIENARLFELEQQRRRLADTLRGVAETISSKLDFDELLNIVLQELAKVVDYDSASVQLLQEDHLVIIGGRGWEDPHQVIGLTFSMEDDNPNRRVIETQEPLNIRNAPLAYPEVFARPPHDQIKSWLGVPLTYGINVLGLMAVESYAQTDFFTEEDAQVVLAFASQVAVALQNAHLFEEARQQVRQLAALTQVAQSLNRALDLNEVLNLVLDGVFDLVGQSKGSIWLIDYNTNTVKIADTKNVPSFLVELFNKSGISIDSEPFASVIKSSQLLVIGGSSGKDDIAHYGLPFPNDVTYVPLNTEAGVIGILAIEVIIQNKNMLKLVTTLADLAAVAIDSARLLEDTRRRANEMQNLYRLGVEVSGLLDMRQVMRSVVSNALTLTDTQIGAILLWDEEFNRYIIDGALNTQEAVAQMILNEAKESLGMGASASGEAPLWSDLTRQIIDTAQPLIIGSATAPVSEALASARGNGGMDIPPANGHSKWSLPLGIRAMLGVPIQVRNEINGAIFVCNLAARNFNQRDIQLLSFVANQAAVSVRNAQLVQRLNLLTEELEERVAQRTEELAKTLQDLTEERDRAGALYQITRELSASFDLDRVLVEALSLINRAVGISHGSILLLDHETGNFVYRAALGRDKPLSRGGLKTKYRPGYGLAGKVIETRQPRLVPDLAEDPDWVFNKEMSDRRSALAVPLLTGEDPLGVLILFHPEINYFTEDHLQLVSAAGAQVATAINKAELFRLITDQAERLGVMLRTQVAEATKNQAILKGITDGVLVLDAKRNIVLVNPKTTEILNIKAENLENHSIHQSLGQLGPATAEPDFINLFYRQLLKGLAALEAGESSTEFRVETGPKVVATTLVPLKMAAEGQPSIIAVLRDISREAEIDRLKNEFISTVSHELRTPMTSIKGYADLLVSGSTQVGELNPIQRRFVQVIQANANRLSELVNDILEISRIETGRVKLDLEALDIAKLIEEVAVSFEGQTVKKAMNLSLDLPPDLPYVYADKGRVAQILVNLVGNAWQYTPEGGNIVVHATVADDNFIQIDVDDTGIGIIEKDIQFVFDRFFRSERTEVQVVDGTGLGLSITKMFVEMLGGQIWLKSQLDVGTTFSFTLPLAVNQAQASLSPGPEEAQAQQAQVLLIDDNIAVTDLLKSELEHMGYQVVVAIEREQALKLARQARPTLKLIMLNLLLKDADSFLLLKQLQQDKTIGDLPLVISALTVDKGSQDLDIEVMDYVATSFEKAQVLERVSLALGLTLDKAQAADEEIQTPALKKGRNILVVGHNQATIEWLKEALEAGGYKVQRAFNSRQALDLATANKPDLTLLDLKMPDVDGASVISQLRRIAAPEQMPIMAIVDQPISARENDGLKMLGRENWAKVKHPFIVDALVAEIIEVGDKTGSNKRRETIRLKGPRR